MAITGTTCLLRGEPVTVFTAWRTPRKTDPPRADLPLLQTGGTPPRNVEIRYADGRRVVRPFRGLRKMSSTTSTGA